MLDSVYKDFGFIKRPEGGREDNVYFPRLALVTAEDKKVLDLVKELPAGCKVTFLTYFDVINAKTSLRM